MATNVKEEISLDRLEYLETPEQLVQSDSRNLNTCAESEFQVREYQRELYHKAMERNCIIFLGTGTGKTYIAQLVIDQLMFEVIGSINDGKRRTLFLCPTATLASQQCDYLKKHLYGDIVKIIKIIGASGVEDWHEEKYKSVFEENHVFVMTPQVLCDILSKNIVNIRCFNLIVFDEVHHGTKDHPYKRIMEFYHEDKIRIPGCRLPKIMGLTATIIKHALDTGTKLEKEISQLEQTFDSKIITVDDILKVEMYGSRPDCLIISYREPRSDSSSSYFKDRLADFQKFLAISQKGKIEETFDFQITSEPILIEDTCIPKNFKDLKSFSATLVDTLENIGPWAARQLAQLIINRIDASYLSIDTGYILAASINLSCLLKICVHKFNSERLLNPTHDITNKCSKLVEILETLALDDQYSVIVFVQKRLTSYVLSNYFNELKRINPKLASIRCHHFTGQSNSTSNIIPDECMSIGKQKTIISQFYEGELNVLFATSVLIEGIDVKRCNCVIIFDEIYHYCYFTQSRGRARMKNGKYYYLVNEEKMTHVENNFTKYNEIEDSIRNIVLDQRLEREEEYETFSEFFETNKGAKLRVEDSIRKLSEYCQTLITDNNDNENSGACRATIKLKKVKVPGQHNLMFLCLIFMPKSCYKIIDPISSGDKLFKKKKSAKQMAAYNACRQLYEIEELDEHLEPARKRLQKIAQYQNGKLHVKEKHLYTKRIPDMLSKFTLSNSQKFYMYPFIFPGFIPYNDVQNKILCRSFAILTTCLFEVNEILPIHLINPYSHSNGNNLASEFTACIYKHKLIEISPEHLKNIKAFHHHIFKVILNYNSSNFVYDSLSSPKQYLIVPIVIHPHEDILTTRQCEFKIDFGLINELLTYRACYPHSLPVDKVDEFYIGRIISKNYDQKYLNYYYKVIDVDRNTNVFSKFCDPCKADTYKDYFEKHYFKNLTSSIQPGLIVLPIRTHLLSFLKKHKIRNDQTNSEILFVKQQSKGSITLFPELVQDIPLASKLWPFISVLPSILHRFESYISTLEFRSNHLTKSNFNGSLIPLHKLLSALTLAKCHEEIELERYEFFGDSCLKFLISFYVYSHHKNKDQGYLTDIKSYRVSNFVLFKIAKELQIPEYQKAHEFLPKDRWFPPMFTVNMHIDKENINPNASQDKDTGINGLIHKYNIFNDQSIGDKSLADSFESILGVILNSFGLVAVMCFLIKTGCKCFFNEVLDDTTFTNISPIFLDPNDPEFYQNRLQFYLKNGNWFRNLYKVLPESNWNENKESEYFKHHYIHLKSFAEEVLQFDFDLKVQHKYILLESLTHESHSRTNLTGSYQRLEFLGDAILDYIIISYLMAYFPEEYQPKDLHILKSCVVSNRSFARLALKLKFHEVFLYSNSFIQADIEQYHDYILRYEKDIDFFDKELKIHILQKKKKKNKNNNNNNDNNNKNNNNDLLIVKAPKALGDLFESVCGAAFLMSDFNLEHVWKFTQPFLENTLLEFHKSYRRYMSYH